MNELVGTTYRTVANYGQRDEVEELAERLRIMMPGGMNYTEKEALTLAQIAVAHDLDPFNGEVWLIKNEETGKVYGALIGIKGHRKHAKRQANYWGVGHNGGFERVTDPDKLKQYGAVENSIVFEYRIMDDVIQSAYTASIANLIKAGVPFAEVVKLFGPPPVTIGVGIWSPGDKTKMKPSQCAMFRAEKDALKRRFDVKFTIELDGRLIPVTTTLEDHEDIAHAEIENEYTDILDEQQTEDEILTQLGFPVEIESNGHHDPAPQSQPNNNNNGKPASIYDAIVAAGLSENVHSAKSALNKCKTGYETLEKAIAWMRLYRGWRDTGLDSNQAAEKANLGKAPKIEDLW